MPSSEFSNLAARPVAEHHPAPFLQSRVASLLEVGIGFALIEAALWEGRHIAPWAWLALAWIIASTLNSGFSWRALGVTAEGFRPALWVAGAGLLLAGAIAGGGAVAGSLHLYTNQLHPGLGSLLYIVWALVQEFILQSFLFLHCERILKSGKNAVWAAGGLFFLAHLPNPVLLIAAAIAGPLLCELFRRYRNIYPLAIAHGLVGLALAVAIPDVIHHQMKVGFGYLYWR